MTSIYLFNLHLFKQAASEYARNMKSPFVAWNVDALMKQQGVGTFMKYPARNWTFEGILDGMMEAINDPTTADLFPVAVPFDKFGWFYPVNNDEKPQIKQF